MDVLRERWSCPVCDSLAKEFHEAFDRYVEAAADLYQMRGQGLRPAVAEVLKEIEARQEAENRQRLFYRHRQTRHRRDPDL